MRRSTVLSFPLQLVLPGSCLIKIKYCTILSIEKHTFYVETKKKTKTLFKSLFRDCFQCKQTKFHSHDEKCCCVVVPLLLFSWEREGGLGRERERERERGKQIIFPFPILKLTMFKNSLQIFFLKVKSEKETKNCEPELKRVRINQHIRFPPNVFCFPLSAPPPGFSK